ANFELQQQQMKRASDWRLNLRRQVLGELAGLGRVQLVNPNTNRAFPDASFWRSISRDRKKYAREDLAAFAPTELSISTSTWDLDGFAADMSVTTPVASGFEFRDSDDGQLMLGNRLSTLSGSNTYTGFSIVGSGALTLGGEVNSDASLDFP